MKPAIAFVRFLVAFCAACVVVLCIAFLLDLTVGVLVA